MRTHGVKDCFYVSLKNVSYPEFSTCPVMSVGPSNCRSVCPLPLCKNRVLMIDKHVMRAYFTTLFIYLFVRLSIHVSCLAPNSIHAETETETETVIWTHRCQIGHVCRFFAEDNSQQQNEHGGMAAWHIGQTNRKLKKTPNQTQRQKFTDVVIICR